MAVDCFYPKKNASFTPQEFQVVRMWVSFLVGKIVPPTAVPTAIDTSFDSLMYTGFESMPIAVGGASLLE